MTITDEVAAATADDIIFAEEWLHDLQDLIRKARNAKPEYCITLATLLRACCAAIISGEPNLMWQKFDSRFVGLEEIEAYLHLANEVSPSNYQSLIWDHDGIMKLADKGEFGFLPKETVAEARKVLKKRVRAKRIRTKPKPEKGIA